MIGFSLKVHTPDETYLAPITPRVAVNFERHFKTGLVKALSQDQKIEHLLWLGWECSRASGRSVKPFDSWLDEITNVDFVAPESTDMGKD
jgi:hypothetical protein